MRFLFYIKRLFFYFTLLLVTIPLIGYGRERPKIGLVLSGGGAKGMAHIGVIRIIEQLNIPIDYVTGTSMGSVIGSLYASGYSIEEIDSIAQNINWNKLFNDKLSRNKVSIEEKYDMERYILEMPIRNYHFELPQGLIAGQRLSQMLSTLLLPVHNITDFTKLPIPFKCIATNAVTGDAVVLDHGDLAISVRASMAIPSIFNPVEINDTLLVDGGIIRNFPVIDAKEMGADIIIGVDVGGPLFKKEQLKTLVSIMQQTVAFRGNIINRQQEDLCDILITPNIEGIDASSFGIVNSIIIRGEKAALKVYPQLKALSDSLNLYSFKKKKIQKPKTQKKYFISNIEIKGNHNISDDVIRQKLYITPNEFVTIKQINENVQALYSTKFFKNIYFQIVPDKTGAGNTLKLQTVEENISKIKLGIHYDNDLKSALLLNFTTRNLILNGSKLSVDGRFSVNPAIRSSYFYYTGYKPDIGIGFISGYSNINIAEYEFGDQRVGTTVFHTFYADLRLNTILVPSLSVSLGTRYEFNKMGVEGMLQGSKLGLSIDLPIRLQLSEVIDIYNFYATFDFDDINSLYFTKKGTKIFFRLAYIPHIKNSDLNVKIFVNPDDYVAPEENYKIKYNDYFRLNVKLQQSIPFYKHFSITGQVRGGFINKNLVPLYDHFMLGGISRETRNIIPFIGARLLQHSATNYMSALLSVQYEPLVNKFIVLTANAGYLAGTFEDFLTMSIGDDRFIYGYGLTLGMNSLIGPLALTFMTKDNPGHMLVYVNIGYSF